MSTQLKILLVEDDPDDVELFGYALEEYAVACHLDVIMEGDGVLPFLKMQAILPDVIVLDLNLPRVLGREVLSLLKAHVRFRTIPVMILTTSSTVEEREACLALGAEQFLTKPSDQRQFGAVIGTIVGVVSEDENAEAA
ncbi:MAG: response regulator [Sphingobacteriaceae bacterium]|nr:response regulator [Cytophagaceae bacterium]